MIGHLSAYTILLCCSTRVHGCMCTGSWGRVWHTLTGCGESPLLLTKLRCRRKKIHWVAIWYSNVISRDLNGLQCFELNFLCYCMGSINMCSWKKRYSTIFVKEAVNLRPSSLIWSVLGAIRPVLEICGEVCEGVTVSLLFPSLLLPFSPLQVANTDHDWTNTSLVSVLVHISSFNGEQLCC